MARIRTIKPEFWTDSFMVQLPPLARLIYISLWTAADDHGLIPDEPERLAMEVMPREDGLVFDDWLQFFEASGRIERLYAEGFTYYRIAKWESHQRVDKPGRSRIAREGSRKLAIPLAVRRKVAAKYSCPPGECVGAECFYCGAPGQVHWHKLFSGRPSGWVTFPGLELDHVHPEVGGGPPTAENIVLACRGCNRSKGQSDWIEFLCQENQVAIPELFAKAREHSCKERNREQGKEGNGVMAPPAKPALPAEPALILMPLNDGSEYPVTESQAAEFSTLYPSVDVRQELRAMRAWAIANPSKRKTKGGVMRFVNSWLAKEQDKGGKPNGRVSELPLPRLQA